MSLSNLASWSVPLALAMSSALAGCGGGALRQAAVADSCAPGDPDCSRAGFDAPLALGATARPVTKISLTGSAAPGIHYESAAPDILEVDGGVVIGKSAGASALLFVSDADTVLDFLHVWVKAPTALDVTASTPGSDQMGHVDGPLELMVGEDAQVAIAPSADGQRLLGTSAAEWTIEPAIAILLREGSDARRRIVASAPGKAVIHVKMLGLESTIDVRVHSPREAGGAS
jgi:hypothetical protein